ncbi:MAG: thioredoxin domain-containing protein [Rhodospirillales bacterium]|nr:thioredoxin domain-containing protein [Rhodospirillales bacterium]
MTFLRCAILTTTILFTGLCTAPPVMAQTTPPMPAVLQTMASEGAQLRYLGREQGLDGWIAIKNGEEQYFYVTENGEALVMGILFDKNGQMVTLKQVHALQEKEGAVLDLLAEEKPVSPSAAATTEPVNKAFKSPAEQLFDDVQNSNWIPLGSEDAPVIYTFIDPQCPHCKAFIQDLRHNYIDNGLLQMRIIPVGFKPETEAQAAFLLAMPNPQQRFFQHLDGVEDALPVSGNLSRQGVQRNLAIMQSWKFNATPISVYRAADGTIKIIEGRASDIATMMGDLSPAP